jgi:hypothetical protein
VRKPALTILKALVFNLQHLPPRKEERNERRETKEFFKECIYTFVKFNY